MSDGETFSWGKLISGFFNPLNGAKSLVFLFHSTVIITILMAVVFSGIKLYGWATREKPTDKNSIVITENDGTVNASSDKSLKKFGIITF